MFDCEKDAETKAAIKEVFCDPINGANISNSTDIKKNSENCSEKPIAYANRKVGLCFFEKNSNILTFQQGVIRIPRKRPSRQPPPAFEGKFR